MVFLNEFINYQWLTNLLLSIISAAGVGLIFFVRYSWNEREKRTSEQINEQTKYNVKLLSNLEKLSEDVSQQKEIDIKLEGSINLLNQSTENLTGWLKKVQNGQDKQGSEINKNTKDIAVLKGKINKN